MLEMDGIKKQQIAMISMIRIFVVDFGWHFSKKWLLAFLECNTFWPLDFAKKLNIIKINKEKVASFK
jgi:hypothetical protein